MGSRPTVYPPSAVPTRILHVSDLHIGTREDEAVARALASLVEQMRPELLAVTGDLTHRNKPAQHEAGARFLRGLGGSLLVVPGNHDIPLWPPARFLNTFAAFERTWGDTQPVYASETLHLVGLNSVRPWRHQSGGLRRSQLAWAAARLEEAAPGALRVVALHHHMIGAVVISVAPGLGQPRPRRRGEARGLHLYESGERTIAVSTYIWRDDDWALSARRIFPRGTEPLTEVAAPP